MLNKTWHFVKLRFNNMQNKTCAWKTLKRTLNNSYLKASMTYDEMGDAPGRPGCQDNDTLFLVTSVTWGLEGGPGSSLSSLFLTTRRAPASDGEEKDSQYKRRISGGENNRSFGKPQSTFDFQEGAPWSFSAGTCGHAGVDTRIWELNK